MALTRLSNDKWIDPSYITAIERSANKQGYLVTLVGGGEPKLLTEKEFAKLNIQ